MAVALLIRRPGPYKLFGLLRGEHALSVSRWSAADRTGVCAACSEANPWRCLQGPERLPTPAGYPAPVPATETRVFPAEFQGSGSDRGNPPLKNSQLGGARCQGRDHVRGVGRRRVVHLRRPSLLLNSLVRLLPGRKFRASLGATGCSGATVRVHVVEVCAASLDFFGPGQPNLFLETGEAVCADFRRSQLLIQ